MQTPLEQHPNPHAQQIIQAIRQGPKHEKEQDQDHFLDQDLFEGVEENRGPCQIKGEGDQSQEAGHGQDQGLIVIVDPDPPQVQDIMNTEEDQADHRIE